MLGSIFEAYWPPVWNGLNFDELEVDEAYLNITSSRNGLLKLYSLPEDCKKCPFVFHTNIDAESSNVIHISTRSRMTWRIYSSVEEEFMKPVAENSSLICEITSQNIGEFGVYELAINKNDTCQFSTIKESVSIYSSLFAIAVGLFVIYICIIFSRKKFGQFFASKKIQNENEILTVSDTGKKVSSRVKAIDTFRGVALCIMILVNDGGGKYWFLMHTPWDGIVLADAVFPWFLWIMGICIALSHKSALKSNVREIKTLRSILYRGCILFMLGLSLNCLGIGPNLKTLRIVGVLQRFSVSYIVVAIIATLLPVKDHEIRSPIIHTTLMIWQQWISQFCIIVIHLIITFYFPVPACPRGYLGAGGIQENGLYENCTGGATSYIDKLILGENHLWKGTIEPNIYYIERFDPENILGCLTSIFQVFLGLQAGCILIHGKDEKNKICDWLFWGFLYLIIGYSLDFFNMIPINKNLWSLSFVFVTSGYAFAILTFFYSIIDLYHLWNGSPFIYPGMNSIVVYIGHELCYNLLPWHFQLETMNTHFILLLESVWGVFLWILISAWLYQKHVFISI